jgi:two-component system phosphate regulon sensor histidine kinase PhoR
VPDASTLVVGDPEGLRQVVDNLVDNAIKYTGQGGRVDVRLALDGRHAMLDVEDSGIGIEPRDQERIFERFYRVDKARSRELGGTGLGLAIVKHVVRTHGGQVAVRSAPGVGSTFSVRLPLAS